MSEEAAETVVVVDEEDTVVVDEADEVLDETPRTPESLSPPRSPPGSAQKISEQSPDGRYFHYNEIVGVGSYKKVYKAIDKETGRYLAWNRVALDGDITPEDFKRLYKEIQILKQVNHPNLIAFYDSWIDEEKGALVFMTELMTSGTLSAFLKRLKVLRLSVIQNWLRQILSGLHYLHTRNPCIIHRDIKANNVFIDATSSENNMKIGDLGLATLYDGTASAQPMMSVIGTPEYMAPEYYDEAYTELVDIWAFGLVALEMVTRQVPYHECGGLTGQIFRKVRRGELPGDVARLKPGSDIEDFIQQCLLPANERPSAAVLLQHRFLTTPQSGDTEDIFMSDLEVASAASEKKAPPEESRDATQAKKERKERGFSPSSGESDREQPVSVSVTTTVERREGDIFFFCVKAERDSMSEVETKTIRFTFDRQNDDTTEDARGVASALGDMSVNYKHIARRMEALIKEMLPAQPRGKVAQTMSAHTSPATGSYPSPRKESAPPALMGYGLSPYVQKVEKVPVAESITRMADDNLRALGASMRLPGAAAMHAPIKRSASVNVGSAQPHQNDQRAGSPTPLRSPASPPAPSSSEK